MKSIGIDIGGTQLRAAIFDEEFKQIGVFKTDNDRSLTAEQNMDKLLDYLMDQDYHFSGIGIGCPGPLNIRLGKVLNPPNLVGWDNFEIVKYVEEKTHLKTYLNNDANVAGLAEAKLGSGAGFESVVFMGISTGIGGAYVYKNELVNGANSNAAEFWNMIVNEDEYCHKNANPGSLNEQASGSALTRMAAETYGEGKEAKDLFEYYHQNDSKAEEIVEQAAGVLAKGIANITNIIDPDIIIIGGSVALHNVDFVENIIEKSKQYITSREFLHVELAQYGDDAGLYGAALLA